MLIHVSVVSFFLTLLVVHFSIKCFLWCLSLSWELEGLYPLLWQFRVQSGLVKVETWGFSILQENPPFVHNRSSDQAPSMVSFWTLLLINQTYTGTMVLAPASLVFGVKFLTVWLSRGDVKTKMSMPNRQTKEFTSLIWHISELIGVAPRSMDNPWERHHWKASVGGENPTRFQP